MDYGIDLIKKLKPAIFRYKEGNNKKHFGLLSISIGIVSILENNITHVAQFGEKGAELKKLAKSQEISCFVRDQRIDD